jgi:energy-coupling factor transport system ATP-binding protein
MSEGEKIDNTNKNCTDSIIEIKNTSVSYRTDKISRGVVDVTLDIKRGSFVAILGSNGSGKSTLAKLINGFLLPDTGKVTVAGISTVDESRIYDIRSKVGIVFQNPDNQMVATIIEDDIAFGPENLGVPRAEIRERVDWALKTVGMYEYRERTAQRLSGGQKQRVAIAAVLAMQPEVLILDESTAMLDPRGRSEVMETAHMLNKEKGMTVILITHYMDEAVNADEVIVLYEGRVVANGTPQDVFLQSQSLRQIGLELPIATRVAEKLRESGFDISLTLTDEEFVEAICQLK